MTKKDKGPFSAKHPAHRQLDAEIARAVKERSAEGKLTCALAFTAASDLKVSPGEIGFALDCLEIGISQCQLGLFGFSPVKRIVKPAESVAPELAEAIQGALVDQRLPCAAAWSIAKSFRMAKIRVSAACEKMKIKISSCQLGAF